MVCRLVARQAAHAREIARDVGSNHTELQLDGRDALALVPGLPELLDEPLEDPSYIPTYFVCHLARQHVTVALTGDGGDELFGGYNRYIAAASFDTPTPRRLPASGFSSMFSQLLKMFPRPIFRLW